MELDADVGSGPDHDLLEVAHEPHRVGPRAEIEHRVPDELSGPVERERAAAIDEPELGAGGRDPFLGPHDVVGPPAPAGRVDRWMLEQDQRVFGDASQAALGQRVHLGVRGVVVDETLGPDQARHRARAPGPRRSPTSRGSV
jgi:hypothetical protein